MKSKLEWDGKGKKKKGEWWVELLLCFAFYHEEKKIFKGRKKEDFRELGKRPLGNEGDREKEWVIYIYIYI